MVKIQTCQDDVIRLTIPVSYVAVHITPSEAFFKSRRISYVLKNCLLFVMNDLYVRPAFIFIYFFFF